MGDEESSIVLDLRGVRVAPSEKVKAENAVAGLDEEGSKVSPSRGRGGNAVNEQELLAAFGSELVVADATVGCFEVCTSRKDVGRVGRLVVLGRSLEHLGVISAEPCVGQEVEQRGSPGGGSESHSTVLKAIRV